MPEVRKWIGDVPSHSDFGGAIIDEFIDGRTTLGPAAFMTPAEFKIYGRGLGTGFGQRYKKNEKGEWIKVEG